MRKIFTDEKKRILEYGFFKKVKRSIYYNRFEPYKNKQCGNFRKFYIENTLTYGLISMATMVCLTCKHFERQDNYFESS